LILGLYTWQWLFLAALVAGSGVAVWLVRQTIGRLIQWGLKRAGVESGKGLVRAVSRSLALGIVCEVVRFLLPWIGLAAAVTHTIEVWIDALAVVFIGIAAYRVVDLVCHSAVGHFLRHRSNGRDVAQTLAPLVASALKVVVMIVGLTVVLGILGVNVAAIITGLSIGGVALAFAAQDTIKNLFGSVMILADQPFVVGDWVVLQDVEGVVQEIGFRSTRIRTFADSVVTLPNGRLADMTVDNLGLRSYRRYRTSIVLDHGTSVHDVIAFQDAIRNVILAHPLTVKSLDRINIAMTEISSLGFVITVAVFTDAHTMTDEPSFKNEINLGIADAAEKHAVHFAKQGDVVRA